MKSGFALLILSACLVAASAQASNLNTTSNLINEGIEPVPAPTTILDGIPLMEGLQIAPDKNFIKILPDFGDQQSPTVTVGIIDVDDVYNFYQRTLPPLGWKAINGRSYMHGNESLYISALADGKLGTVTFAETTAP